MFSRKLLRLKCFTSVSSLNTDRQPSSTPVLRVQFRGKIRIIGFGQSIYKFVKVHKAAPNGQNEMHKYTFCDHCETLQEVFTAKSSKLVHEDARAF